MIRTLQFAACLAGAVAFSNVAIAAETNCPQQDYVEAGSFTLTKHSAGFIVGVRWGNGELTLKDGTKRKFRVRGGKLMEIGVSSIEFEGRVYNLKNTQAFTGTYIGVGGGSTLFTKGFGAYHLTNGACTVISMKAKSSSGLQLSAPMLNGMTVSFTN